MIVDAFTESLEIGLESPGQVVVSVNRLTYLIATRTGSHLFPRDFSDIADDPNFRVWMARRT